MPSATCPVPKRGTGPRLLPQLNPVPGCLPTATFRRTDRNRRYPPRRPPYRPFRARILAAFDRRHAPPLYPEVPADPAQRGQPRAGHGRHLGPVPERAEETGPDARRRGRRRPRRRQPGAATAPRLSAGRGTLARGHAGRLLGRRGYRLPGTGSPRSGTWSGPIPTNCSRSQKSSRTAKTRSTGFGPRRSRTARRVSGPWSFSRTAAQSIAGSPLGQPRPCSGI